MLHLEKVSQNYRPSPMNSVTPSLTTPPTDKMVDVVLSYDPFTGNWEVQRSDEGATAMCEKLQAIKLSPKHPA